jgi:4-diphosphocytidyl-2-C-methyl-D-erythritol kinase
VGLGISLDLSRVFPRVCRRTGNGHGGNLGDAMMATQSLLAHADLAHAAPTVTVRGCAKLNLSLAVLDRRPDGFHEIESLMVPVSLADTVLVRATDVPGIRLAVRFGGRLAGAGRALARDVPTDDRNLVVRAARALAEQAGCERGLAIELVKGIPSGAGLGGGSSDAAAVLRAAATAWNIDWPTARLAAIGAGIGSDVPWFFAGGAAIVRGRGDVVDSVPALPPLFAVIACPATGLSTAEVYAGCRPDATRRGDADRLAAVLARGGFAAAVPLMANALEPPARRLCPDIERLLADLRRTGGTHPRLTGSGSACFALARTAAEARGIAARLTAIRGDDGSAAWPGVFAVRVGGGSGDPRGGGPAEIM